MADAATMEQLKEQVTTWAQGLASATGLDLKVRVARDEPEGITLSFDGPDAGLFSGRKGEVLDALQLLASFSLKGRGYPRLHLLFDADGYRERREQVLTQMASELAEEVVSSGQEAELEPLSAMERRIIHKVLVEIPGIRTYSEGEEPRRYIVIAPAE
jgi:spoIIIJ-associated protein